MNFDFAQLGKIHIESFYNFIIKTEYFKITRIMNFKVIILVFYNKIKFKKDIVLLLPHSHMLKPKYIMISLGV
jgi:hypothetical protein